MRCLRERFEQGANRSRVAHPARERTSFACNADRGVHAGNPKGMAVSTRMAALSSLPGRPVRAASSVLPCTSIRPFALASVVLTGPSLHGEHRQPVVEIDAEAAGLGLAAEVAVGRGDDARPRHPGLRLADALVFAVFQHAQQLRLELERQFADLVEEQRALGGVLEVAGARCGRAGERALRVAEQRGFDERRRDRGAVQGERARAARGPSPWSARATSSLPLPDSPSIRTGKTDEA
jgi:hypothetical protein